VEYKSLKDRMNESLKQEPPEPAERVHQTGRKLCQPSKGLLARNALRKELRQQERRRRRIAKYFR
jgi:hypothetical protein